MGSYVDPPPRLDAKLEPKVPRPDVAAVETPVSCATLTASVGALPAATLVIWRRPAAVPTDTSPMEVCDADKPKAV